MNTNQIIIEDSGKTNSNERFLMVPKKLFEDETYKEMTAEAKLLYSLMLDRLSLSEKNGWHDKNGNVYLYYTQNAICEILDCRTQKAASVLNELEKQYHLIRRKRQGCGLQNKIYVHSLFSE